MAKILPILLMLLGLPGAWGAGFCCAPRPPRSRAKSLRPPPIEAPVTDLYELEGQFLVPLSRMGASAPSWSSNWRWRLTMPPALTVADKEPLLRDRMLQILFDHANIGGFEGMFTANNNMALLRKSLLEAATQVMGDDVVFEVLITNILRNSGLTPVAAWPSLPPRNGGHDARHDRIEPRDMMRRWRACQCGLV